MVPLYNEMESVPALLDELHEALAEAPFPYEIICVDDGSRDRTWEVLRAEAARRGDHVRALRFRRNFGQSAAMQAGIDAARGEVIVTLDGDLQNDPHDIPRLVARLCDEDLDLVSGWRHARQDAYVSRKLPSQLANGLISRLTGVRLHDYGCTLKAYRAEVLRHVRLYGEMHRFLPAWMAKYTALDRIAEEPVNHRARRFGGSKYGISRIVRVLLDLVAVVFFMRYSVRPGHAFGAIGIALGTVGGLVLTYLLALKISGEDIGNRPLLMTGVLLVLVAVQLVTTGVMSELLTRVYYEAGSTDRRPYLLREEANAPTPGWHRR